MRSTHKLPKEFLKKMLASTTLREHLHERQTFNAKIGQLERLDSV